MLKGWLWARIGPYAVLALGALTMLGESGGVVLADLVHASKPSDVPSCGRTIGFVGHIGNDVTKGPSAIRSLVICARLPRRVRLSNLPLGGQVRADLSRAKSAKGDNRLFRTLDYRIFCPVLAQSAMNCSSPLSVSTWFASPLITAGGAVITSAPIRAQSLTWLAVRMEAARIWVLKS
jgi:hypothetical protein